jgi:hypothetical protein
LFSPFPNNDPCNGETSKSEEGVSRWLSIINHWQSHRGSRRAILVGVTVSNVQKCHHSAVRTCVSQGTSPGTPRDKIQHYRSIVDRYKISEREGVDTLFYSKLNNIF